VVKINFFLSGHPQSSLPATRAQVTLSFDWLAFAVKVTLVGSCSGKIARVPNWLVRFGTAYREVKVSWWDQVQ